MLGVAGPVVRDATWARSLPEGAQVLLPAGRYTGPWRFQHQVSVKAEPGAILSPSAELDPGLATLTLQDGGRIEGLTIEATTKGYALRVEGGTAVLARLHLGGRGQAALYIVRSKVTVSDCEFQGNDYGLLAEGPSTVAVSGSRFGENHRAGVGAVNTAITVADSMFTGPFYEAALTIIHSDSATLSGNQITAAGAAGIKLLTSKAVLTGGKVQGARSDANGLEGDGLYSFQSRVESEGLRIGDTHGTGVWVSGGHVALAHCEIAQSSEAAASVGGNGTLTLSKCHVVDSPVGVFVDPDGTANTEGSQFEHVAHLVVKGR
jgi:hypothetical protein